AEAQTRLLENREFFRFRNESDLNIDVLQVGIDDVVMGEWEFESIRKLFDVLEFRLLYERLSAGHPDAQVAVKGFEAHVEVVADGFELAEELADISPLVVRIIGDSDRFQSKPDVLAFVVPDGGRVFHAKGEVRGEIKGGLDSLGEILSQVPLVTHGSKEALQRLMSCGIDVQIAMDNEIAAYLLDPARGSYALDEMAREYLGRELKLDAGQPSDGQQSLSLDDEQFPGDSAGLEAIVIGLLAEIMQQQLRDRGAWELLTDLELPLARVLAKVETNGVKIDVGYLQELSATMSKQMSAIEGEIFEHAGGPFNIGSPPQLRTVLYERLGLKPSKKTKTGFSTDASVLESLREEHPIIDLILKHREKSKLKSTYLDALPPLVDRQTGRVHCRFNQTVAATGRLSAERPNLQNIPIRTAEGKQIRRAFIPEEGNAFVVADYSQIELRIIAHLSEDTELVAAFHRGDDIHRNSIASALGIAVDEVTPELRSIGKMVTYGVAYGMGPFGLSQRLRIPVDQARVYIDGFFGLYPSVRTYLDAVVEQATEDGYTTTMLGRRRYVPELKSRNPRVRSLGERQALNAPIQGTAADIMKLAMIHADAALAQTSAKMVMTVHDELVFEVPTDEVADVTEKVRTAMQGAIELSVPLSVDLAWGPNWAEAKA
ncbi:MAG: DNA polymerase I, partial [Actinomycetota bacterium]